MVSNTTLLHKQHDENDDDDNLHLHGHFRKVKSVLEHHVQSTSFSVSERDKRADAPGETENSNTEVSVSPSFDGMDADSVALALEETETSTATTSSCCCFFPEHTPLQGDVPRKVLKYAQRRLTRSGMAVDSPLQSTTGTGTSTGTPLLLEHSQVELGEVIGHGSFSAVYKVASLKATTTTTTHSGSLLPSSQNLVVKVLRKKLMNNPPMMAACAADLVKEGLILSKLSHPNILGLRASSSMTLGVQAFASGRYDAFFLVLEKLHTTLSDKLLAWRDFKAANSTWNFLQSKKVLQAKLENVVERCYVMETLAQAVAYLHSQNILHRDLKPDNIGFDAHGTLKVFDFDVARSLPASHAQQVNAAYKMTKRVGSPRYMSPECARGEPYNAKADVYSFALLCHEIYSLQKPYDDVPPDLHDSLVFNQGARPCLNPTWPQPFRHILHNAWSPSIYDRPTMHQLQLQLATVTPLVISHKKRKYSKFSWLTDAKSTKKPVVLIAEESTRYQDYSSSSEASVTRGSTSEPFTSSMSMLGVAVAVDGA